MPIRVKLDDITTLRLKEHNGTLQGVSRKAVVTGLADYDGWLVTMAALNAVDSANPDIRVPRYGDRLVEDSTSVAYTLVVIDRDVEMVDKDKAHITLAYENAKDTDNVLDRFDEPFNEIISGEVRCSIQQKSSNLDNDGNQVVLSHTYPANDKNFPGETREQGGEFTYFGAERTFAIQGIKAINFPWTLANAIIGRVNYFPFSGEQARTWMCVGCNWKLQGNRDGIARYFMRFEFQFNPDTYDPTIVYIDDVTGKAPPGLIQGVGIKTIQKHQGVHFEGIIGTIIHGA